MQNKKSPIKTFRYHDLVIAVHSEVYDPAEDSFLLLETIKIQPKHTVLELGTGSGLIGLDCARHGSTVICTDINPYAVQLTRRNIQNNKSLLRGSIEVRQGNLFSALKKNERFDVIIFNPPYLPTKTKEKTNDWYDLALNGGNDGLKITKRFIHGLKKHLLTNGHAYFIFSSLSPRTTLEAYLKKEGFSYEVVATRRFEGEDLDVYHISPTG